MDDVIIDPTAAAAADVAQALAVAGVGPAFLPPCTLSHLGAMGNELELMVLDRLTDDLRRPLPGWTQPAGAEAA